MRLFFAIPVPETLQDALGTWMTCQRAALPRGSWVDSKCLHLTLAFLGEQPEASVQALCQAGEAAVADHAAFALAAEHLGAFPSMQQARVLWMGVGLDPRLQTMALALRRELQGRGFPPDAKPFQPHLTLARWRMPVALPGLPPIPAFRLPVTEVVLYQSTLKPRGAVHTPLATFALQDGEK